jgi:hypothetical protein
MSIGCILVRQSSVDWTRIADLEADVIRFDCQNCKKENSCIIPNF